jgi:hypothetical protein
MDAPLTTHARVRMQQRGIPGEVALMQCPVAGFQFHAAETCWAALRKNDPLVLRREPGNRHDPRAICVEWQGVRLGYVPREANYAVSQMLDRGARVEARISELRQGADPWQRIMMDVVLAPDPGLARRLALAPRAMVKDGRRCVRLWDAIEISLTEEGRDLGVRFLEPLPGLSAPPQDARVVRRQLRHARLHGRVRRTVSGAGIWV